VSDESGLRTWAAYVEYDGREFVGWQRQEGLRSVQGEVERALSIVAAEKIDIRCAGRTDAGVHGLGQVIHFSSRAEREPRGWMLGTNANLPQDISLYWVGSVPAHFDARFRAVSRRYRYLILNAPARSALWSGRCLYEPRQLEIEPMKAAAECLLGTHDFSSFRGRDCQAKSPVKTINMLELERRGDWVLLTIEAGGFLHNMVRNVVGTLCEIGRGVRSSEWMTEVLDARTRTAAGPTMPPGGLYFIGAKYPPEFKLPAFRDLQLP